MAWETAFTVESLHSENTRVSSARSFLNMSVTTAFDVFHPEKRTDSRAVHPHNMPLALRKEVKQVKSNDLTDEHPANIMPAFVTLERSSPDKSKESHLVKYANHQAVEAGSTPPLVMTRLTLPERASQGRWLASL